MARPLSKAESSYTAVGLLNSQRPDGRSLLDYRPITLATGVAPTANGSARARIGDTDVVVAVKLEVENIEESESEDRCVCSVDCSPSAFPHIDYNALADMSTDLTNILSALLNTRGILPAEQLTIIPGKRRWLLYVDAVVLSHSGNLYDTLFAAARAALWDTKIPRTRSIAYKAPGKTLSDVNDIVEKADVMGQVAGGLRKSNAVDFELEDSWDEGAPLDGSDELPVCLTMNLLAPIYFLDASDEEETCCPTRFLLFVKPSGSVCGMQKLGDGEISPTELKSTLRDGVGHAKQLLSALNARLKDPATASLSSNLGPFA